MANGLIASPSGLISTFPKRSIALPNAPGLTMFHMFTSDLISGTTLKNLAYPGAPVSTITGAPTLDGSTFLANNAGGTVSDYVQTALSDATNYDMTGYFVVLNEDTLASQTTSPMLLSSFTVAANGLELDYNSATAVQVKDQGTVSGTRTNNSDTITVTNLASAWKFFVFTTSLIGTTLTTTLTNFTDSVVGTPAVLTGVSARNVGVNPFRLGATYQSPVQGGKYKMACAALAQTVNGAGGAHTASQQFQNVSAIRGMLANLADTTVRAA